MCKYKKLVKTGNSRLVLESCRKLYNKEGTFGGAEEKIWPTHQLPAISRSSPIKDLKKRENWEKDDETESSLPWTQD